MQVCCYVGVGLEEEGRVFEETLPRFANVLANVFFVLTVAAKARPRVEKVPLYQC